MSRLRWHFKKLLDDREMRKVAVEAIGENIDEIQDDQAAAAQKRSDSHGPRKPSHNALNNGSKRQVVSTYLIAII